MKVTPFVKFTSLLLYQEAENLHFGMYAESNNSKMNFESSDIFVIIKKLFSTGRSLNAVRAQRSALTALPEEATKAKVPKLHKPLLRDKNVCRFYISMHYPSKLCILRFLSMSFI